MEPLSENELKVLKSLDEVTDTWGEVCVSFSYIAGDGNRLSTKEVRIACRSLRKRGFADFYRGLMNEDGEVAGSGYCITREGQLFLRPCIDCKTRISDMVDGRCQDCWESRPCIKCGKPYKDHKSDWTKGGYKVEFSFPETEAAGIIALKDGTKPREVV